MKLFQVILLFCALFWVSQGVVISWEESLEGHIDYRFFYFNVPAEDNGYEKPYFGIVNGLEDYEYGALGSLTCPSTGSSVAVYADYDSDGKKEWRCVSINVLPFAGEPTPVNPPICSVVKPTGIPALWNDSTSAWECGDYNQILTLAQRIDNDPCSVADFMTYSGDLGEIRCISPLDINPADTAGGAKRDIEEIETRVDTTKDAKWYDVISSNELTGKPSLPWATWQWTPFMNYDSTKASSSIPSPPITMPFATQLLAVTFASFRFTGYTWVIAPPDSTDNFNATVWKLSASLGTTQIGGSLPFSSISATSGQVTFSLTTNAASQSNSAGETFVAQIDNWHWTAFSVNTDVLVVSTTLWVQTIQSFTSLWPLS